MSLDLSQLTFSVESSERERRVHVVVHHPDFVNVPIPDAAEKLEQFENELIDIVEPAGRFIARLTLNGVRLHHLYTASEDHNAADRIAQFADHCQVHHEASHDPGWLQVRAFTG